MFTDAELQSMREYDNEIDRTFKLTQEEIDRSRMTDYWALGLTQGQINEKLRQVIKSRNKPKKDRSAYQRDYYLRKKTG